MNFFRNASAICYVALIVGSTMLIASAALQGIEYSPWYPPIFELQPRLNVTYQWYKQVASNHGSFHEPSYGISYDASLGGAYYDWYGSLELKLADTTARAFGVDHCSASLRYPFLDDVAAEDPVSMTAGFTITNANRKSLLDMSSFHHGQFEGEIHVAVGKETSSGAYWVNHFWGMTALGCADVGSPWLHGRIQWDRNDRDRCSYSLYLNALYGFGSASLAKHKSFRGYGPIKHRSIDLGGNYTLAFESGLKLSAQGSYRLYAVNFPKQAITVAVGLLYPFGP